MAGSVDSAVTRISAVSSGTFTLMLPSSASAVVFNCRAEMTRSATSLDFATDS